MTLLCERCYGPIDPDRERYYELAHMADADRTGRVTWNHSAVHTDPCGSTPVATIVETPEQRRAA